MQLIEGPFKYLDGKWEFKEIENTTIIVLTINYKTKNKLVEYAIGKSLEKILILSLFFEALKKAKLLQPAATPVSTIIFDFLFLVQNSIYNFKT